MTSNIELGQPSDGIKSQASPFDLDDEMTKEIDTFFIELQKKYKLKPWRLSSILTNLAYKTYEPRSS